MPNGRRPAEWGPVKRRVVIALLVIGGLAIAVGTAGRRYFAGAPSAGLTLYGNVDIREVDLAFRVPGRIASVEVDEGVKVTQGQLLASLDGSPLSIRVAQSEAQLHQAKAQLAKLENGARAEEVAQARARVRMARTAAEVAEADYQRRAPLVEPGAIARGLWEQTVAQRDRTKAQLDEAEQALALVQAGARAEDIAAAKAQVAAAEASRIAAATDLDDARLLAPSPGTVVTRAREPGAIVGPGEVVLTLSIDRPVRVRAYIAEPDLSRISPGMAVQVRADGNAKSYAGTIGSISPRAEFTPKSVETESLRTDLVYRVRVIISDPDDALRQGQPVTVEVPGARPGHQG